MAIIGTFARQDDGGYAGAIRTLTLDVPAAELRPNDKSDERAPDFRLCSGGVEFGAAWRKTSRDGREYLSVKLDDPSFAAPVYATLVAVQDGFSLIWSRGRWGD